MQNLDSQEDRKNLIKQILSDSRVRRAVTRRSHYWFFSVFLSNYIEFEIAPFQQEMFELTEGPDKLVVVMAFRGSGKSTIMNLSYALWAILGVPQKKFILIVSKTQSQAKNHLQNIRDELAHNELLKQDLGPFESDDTNWGLSSLVLPKMQARITAASKEQAVRGIRFGPLRPDLIICDDLEDSASVQSNSDRNATYNWLTSEVLAAGDAKTKIIVLGNLLHEDSLLMRLRADALTQKTNLVFRAYPFADDYKQVLWPGKYDTADKIAAFRSSILDEDLWDREFLLKYVPEKQFIEIHKALREWEMTGKKPNDGNPIRMFGKYRISAPLKTFNLFSKLRRERPQIHAQDRVQEESPPQENQNHHGSEPIPAIEKPDQQDCSQQLGTDEGTYPL